ncbi:hypothetical protein A2U01_0069903, partial [Trifolium medium]|nr:hypothetical protein [Trifolium medium]
RTSQAAAAPDLGGGGGSVELQPENSSRK